MPRIIINADDFGRSIDHNLAIDYSFKQGLVYSAGLIVTGKYLPDAVDLMNKGGYVEKVHLHLNFSTSLKDGNPEDKPLTENLRKDPFFCKDGMFRPYRGLRCSIKTILKWRIVYHEMVAQYNRFKEITDGKGDYKHIDFHLWYNLTWSVSVALNVFTRKNHIESVRYIGLHQKSLKYKLFRILSWNPRVKHIPATNIDHYISNHKSFDHKQLLELYCHPHYKEEVLLDDSPSYLGHEKQPLMKQIQLLREIEGIKFISWEDLR